MDDVDYGELLLGLIGTLAARELSLLVARQCHLAPDGDGARQAPEIPEDFDLCAHLPLDASGRRAALLLRAADAKTLVSQARRQGAVANRAAPGEPHQRLASLLAQALARPCALLGFLGGEGLRLRGVTVQDVDTPARRLAHEIAFRRQEMVPGALRLHAGRRLTMPCMLLLPDELLASAAVSLTDPEHLRVTDEVFLEHAPAVGREVEAWLEERLADEETEDGVDLGLLGPPEPPCVELDALSELLAEVLGDLPDDDEDVILQSPEDLVFGQLFFPQRLAAAARQALGCTLRVRAVEMASVSLASMKREPGGLLSRVVFVGGVEGDTCLVFPDKGLRALAGRLEVGTNSLVELLLSPGLAYMESVSPLLHGQVQPLARVHFGRVRDAADQYAVRLRYVLEVEGSDDELHFVQYAWPVFINRIVSALAGQDTELLKGTRRNLMLSFLSLNALIGSVAVADPERAGEWIGPVLGSEYVPLCRPGESLPDMYDLDVLGQLPRAELTRLLEWPPLAGVAPRALARALCYATGDTWRQVVDAGPAQWRRGLQEQARHRHDWQLKELWEALRSVTELLHGGIANSGIEATVAMTQQLGWRKRRLCLAWRLRGPEVLDDGIYIVPFMLAFDTLAELSDRDLTIVLERWVSGRLGLEALGCALSRPRCPVLPRVLRNVSERRRQDIAEAARRRQPEDEIVSAQHFFAEHVYFATLKGIIHPPPVVQAQIDRYLMQVDEELDGWCAAVLGDRTCDRLLARLGPRGIEQLQRLLGREEILWSLQGATAETRWLFLQGLSSEAQDHFLEDLEALGRREETAQRRAWRTAEARLQAVDVARLVLRFEAAAAKRT